MNVKIIELGSLRGGITLALLGLALGNAIADTAPVLTTNLDITEADGEQVTDCLATAEYKSGEKGSVFVAYDPHHLTMPVIDMVGKPMDNIIDIIRKWRHDTIDEVGCCGGHADETLRRNQDIKCVGVQFTTVGDKADLIMLFRNGGADIVPIVPAAHKYVDIPSLIGKSCEDVLDIINEGRSRFIADELAQKAGDIADEHADESQENSPQPQKQHEEAAVPV